MTGKVSVAIGATHPSLAGHFPGDPIVPGAVLLDHAVDCIESVYSKQVGTILVAKFLAPVRPLDVIVFDPGVAEVGRVNLTASVAGVTVLTMSVLFNE